MDYINNLAVQQMRRFTNFKAKNPNLDTLQARLEFFGQPYEIHTSHTILDAVVTIQPIAPPKE